MGKKFIDYLCAFNDRKKFRKSCSENYPKELVLKLEHSGSHATFPDLDITKSNDKISTKSCDKRDSFLFYCKHAKISQQYSIIYFL